MKFGRFQIRVPFLAIVTFVTLSAILLFSYLSNPLAIHPHLLWIIPGLTFFLVIPVILQSMNQRDYAKAAPLYVTEAHHVRINVINESMIGKIVSIEGEVVWASTIYKSRPTFRILDRTGTITVKMFTYPEEDIKVRERVKVTGRVMPRYILFGEPIINAILIEKIQG